jgi:hypothetical protein
MFANAFIKRVYAGCAIASALCPMIIFFVAAMAFTHTTSGMQTTFPVSAAAC